ncbi:hypothetical protein AZE42_11391 [Rhizopogon vesiculosus]|uniref:Uncharacterized protein n=1 Tax=Rhizopogon vesiculosus TaxID=180088 RepID=A0A1J8Q8W5_9AGAM|nr:hypothetical protein AZE42_11391 [Rhizopogon vesiculosus]
MATGDRLTPSTNAKQWLQKIDQCAASEGINKLLVGNKFNPRYCEAFLSLGDFSIECDQCQTNIPDCDAKQIKDRMALVVDACASNAKSSMVTPSQSVQP